MTDIKKSLARKYDTKNRYANFGTCLRRIEISGFRGINELHLSLDYPVTAISGLNGAGKSTLGQLAICAYKRPPSSGSYRRHYVKDFFPVSSADPNPFTTEASVIFHYETDDPIKTQEVTVSRRKKEWSGYKRQPERRCFYIGFTVYIPKIERKDLSIYGGKNLQLTDQRTLSQEIQDKMARIIGHTYAGINFQGISHKKKNSEIGIASRLGYSYSENNMGFGEGRILYIIDKLENAPARSLFVIEEPETSLHENAQYELSKYLIDVCLRRGHQIIISTHSSIIMGALPSESRKLLIRDQNGVTISNGISSHHLRSILSNGNVRGLCICVEDEFAKTLLTEIIRKKKKDLLTAVEIHAIGGKNEVREAVKILKKMNRLVIGVRDADVGASQEEDLHSFPGKFPPEKEVFLNSNVKKYFFTEHNLNIEDILKLNNITDHHKFSECIAGELEMNKYYLETQSIIEYIKSIEEDFDELINDIYKKINK